MMTGLQRVRLADDVLVFELSGYSSAITVAPLDRTEPGVAEQGVKETKGALRPVRMKQVGIIRIPA